MTSCPPSTAVSVPYATIPSFDLLRRVKEVIDLNRRPNHLPSITQVTQIGTNW